MNMLTKSLDFRLSLIGAGKCALQCLVEDISQKNCVRKLVKCLSGRTYSLPSSGMQCHSGRTGPGGGGRPGRPMACHAKAYIMRGLARWRSESCKVQTRPIYHLPLNSMILLCVNTFLLFRGYSTVTHIIQVQFTKCTYYIRTLLYVGRGWQKLYELERTRDYIL